MKVVCTEYGENYAEIAAITNPIIEEYCHKHGYEFVRFLLEDGNNYAYRKHEEFKHLIVGGADLIWYLDCDAIITNLDTPITGFIDAKHDLFVTKDVHEINGGSMILKCNSDGNWVNEVILSMKPNFQNEQNAINWLMGDPQFNQHVKILPHPSINSYDYSQYEHYPNIRSREEGHWHEGDFVLHVPGLPYQKRIEVLKNAKITR